MVEGARLESVYAGNRIEGSNPSLSAKDIVLKRLVHLMSIRGKNLSPKLTKLSYFCIPVYEGDCGYFSIVSK